MINTSLHQTLCAGVMAIAMTLPALAAAQLVTPSPDAYKPPFQRLAPGFSTLAKDSKLLLAPLDVELFNLTAGGVAEPKADWTQAAQGHMRDAINQIVAKSGVSVSELNSANADELADLLHLHGAVARAISLHHAVQSPQKLPTKQGQLEWSFGDSLKPLAAASGARYVLFTWVRDGYASAERKAMMVGSFLLGAALGFAVIPGGGQQLGFASLVDTESGAVLWFNRLQRTSGDLRDAVSARESVGELFAGWPGSAAY